jgi:hypothetical protein
MWKGLKSYHGSATQDHAVNENSVKIDHLFKVITVVYALPYKTVILCRKLHSENVYVQFGKILY